MALIPYSQPIACFEANGVSEFYFVRHGQAESNVSQEKADLDLPLTATGEQQAQAIESKVGLRNELFQARPQKTSQ